MGDYTDLCARLGNGKLTWGDRWEAAAAIRELEARAERAEEAHIFADAARDAADAKLAELEAERDDWKETSARTDDALMRRTRQLADADTRAAAAEATVATLTAQVEAMRGALDRLEAYGFACDAGPLSLCAEWIAIKEELSCRP